jgi:hypothetical protein
VAPAAQAAPAVGKARSAVGLARADRARADQAAMPGLGQGIDFADRVAPADPADPADPASDVPGIRRVDREAGAGAAQRIRDPRRRIAASAFGMPRVTSVPHRAAEAMVAGSNVATAPTQPALGRRGAGHPNALPAVLGTRGSELGGRCRDVSRHGRMSCRPGAAGPIRSTTWGCPAGART